MTSAEFRNWVETQVDSWRAANQPTLPTFYENGELPQPDTVGSLWLDVSVSFLDGESVTVGSRPRGRDMGTVKLMVYAKAGEGMQAADQVIDGLREWFRTNNRYLEAKLDFPRRHSAPPALGWAKAGLLIPFKSDVA